MPQEHALSSEQKKALRNRHPLYTRLSGDVVWGVLEELGYDAEQCGTAMDAFIDEMYGVLEVMQRLETREAAYLVLEQDPACGRCTGLFGKAIPVSEPDWRCLLPPFAVGCRIRCSALTATEARQKAHMRLSAAHPPQCPLVCPLLERDGAESTENGSEPFADPYRPAG